MNIIKNLRYSIFPWIFVLGLLCVILFLSGCTPSPTETSLPSLTQTSIPEKTEAPDPTATLQPSPTPMTLPAINIAPEDLSGIALRFMHPWTGDAAEALEEIATQFSLTNPWDIWVNVEAHGSETALLEALLLDAEADDPPGLIAVHPYQLGALDGAYTTIPLSAYFNDPEWGLDEDARADIPDLLLEPFTQEDELIALPVAPRVTVLFYNQTWADSLGFASLPEDAVAFRQQSCEAAYSNREDINLDNDGTGGWVVNFEPEVLSGWFQTFGGELPDYGTPQLNTEAGQDAFGYLKSAYDQGCFWIGRRPDPYFYFANRYALTYAGSLDQIPDQLGWMNVAESEDQWTAVGFPGPEGSQIMLDGPGLMVGTDSPERQLAAWLFARHLLEPEVQARLVRSLFTIPVKRSALASLEDFAEDFPQWEAGVALLEDAVALPVSEAWGLSQWLLQDAAFRLLQIGELSPEEVLEELDRMIIDLEGASP